MYNFSFEDYKKNTVHLGKPTQKGYIEFLEKRVQMLEKELKQAISKAEGK